MVMLMIKSKLCLRLMTKLVKSILMLRLTKDSSISEKKSCAVKLII